MASRAKASKKASGDKGATSTRPSRLRVMHPDVEEVLRIPRRGRHKQQQEQGQQAGEPSAGAGIDLARPQVETSCLDMFFKSTATMDPYERAIFLEKDDDMARAHSLAASAGDTELRDIVEEHYICFMALNGTLYELDGMKHGPMKHGSSSLKSLLLVLQFY